VVAVSDIQESPAAELRYRHRSSVRSALAELWHSRELVVTLAERDVRARYKQTFLGFAWAFVQPLSLMLVFTLLARHAITVETHGVPYPLFAYVGLIVWGFFSASVLTGGLSLLANTTLLNKVHCPREAFPIAGMAVATMDACIASIALVGMFVLEGFWPRATFVYALPLLLIQITFTLAVTLAISAIVVYIRDLKSVLPLALQIGLFATPVAYGMEKTFDKFARYQVLMYAAFNPLAPVIDGFRRCLLYGRAPDWQLVGIAAVSSVVMLVLAWMLFARLEKGMADVL
jgi:ABC-2 type transport system permease protein/lipopolysaccharide transport system permease protein